jgi:hypothetical protein
MATSRQALRMAFAKERQHPSNSALQWQARRQGGATEDLMVTCPLEGQVRRVDFAVKKMKYSLSLLSRRTDAE